jgi:7,8-dihydropterin-6-yl-methyl-4-(beta-D-ribofuranosyl)aminobenzene 5'-phosphate synthase
VLIPKKESLKYDIESYGLNIKVDNVVDDMQSDEFDHELYLKIKENDKNILVSGCSHRGILNIMDKYTPDVLIGGFHFMKINTKDEGIDKLRKAADELNRYKCDYYTGHCTGEEQYKVLKSVIGERIKGFCTGTNILL